MDKIHATFFKVQGTTLIPLEFTKGPSPVKGHNVSQQSIIDVVKYLFEKDLTDLIAIEVGDFTKVGAGAAGGIKRTSELEIVWGSIEKLTVIFPLNRMVEGASDPVPTGWNSQDDDLVADPEQPPAGEHWNKAKRVDGSVTHKVHYDSIDPMTP